MNRNNPQRRSRGLGSGGMGRDTRRTRSLEERSRKKRIPLVKKIEPDYAKRPDEARSPALGSDEPLVEEEARQEKPKVKPSASDALQPPGFGPASRPSPQAVSYAERAPSGPRRMAGVIRGLWIRFVE